MTTDFRRMVRLVHVCLFFFLMFYQIFLSCAVATAEDEGEDCPFFFYCGNLGNLTFPFTVRQRDHCGVLAIHGCDDLSPNATKTLQFNNIGANKQHLQLQVRNIENRPLSNIVYVSHQELEKDLVNGSCEVFGYNIPLPPASPLGYLQITNNITVFKCNKTLDVSSSPKQFVKYSGCAHQSDTIFFGTQNSEDSTPSSLVACSRVQLPVNSLAFSGDPFTFITAQFPIQVQISDECTQCLSDGGSQCRLDGKRQLFCPISKDPPSKHKQRHWKLTVIGLTVGGVFVISITLLIILQLKKKRYNCSRFLNHSRSIYFDIHPSTNPECVTVDFGVPVFSYEEIQKATNNFDPSKELGSGGFGIVYYGQLQDGREVAIKHLYQHKHNKRRVKQFMNEIQILTHLRHRNLVSLYGCTSPHSHGLLLIYEYIPNGTVASHLHGVLAKPGSLPWPIRMQIATEIASALTYLHASNIIHRDVKTNNIFLDENFRVKVADFGISRLSPTDLSHVSTAPQGTLGYVDPEYHESCQLTKKSDVYSFGVVLIELISSMPAVDDTRNIDEIKLANLAIKKIQRRAFAELVDPSLSFDSNNEFKRMIISVAELAFQCLQRDKNLRPSMDEVWEVLQKIDSGKDEPVPLEVHGGGIL